MGNYPKHTPARIFLVMGDEDVTKPACGFYKEEKK